MPLISVKKKVLVQLLHGEGETVCQGCTEPAGRQDPRYPCRHFTECNKGILKFNIVFLEMIP